MSLGIGNYTARYADYDLMELIDRTGLFLKSSDHDLFLFVDTLITGLLDMHAGIDLELVEDYVQV